ncbi:MAG: MucB/RseB C-terminal domain-containing protein [Gammaproteobacteria bacterium]|nr:MucB/RseB C-terminal domain-containing protein [Gammaproteobacteria bacterium]MDE2023076.1 MucB/RseB C-terminal domain-containing protein [Gammaproteobacteria bacterium]MDE2139796.1 MucB/RseB C-terminal domain-containing protein [Gammaproteobacteria bacterium]
MTVGPRLAITLLMCGLLAPAAQADAHSGPGSSPQVWLQRMNLALRDRNYTGTFVYVHADHLESMRIFHRADAQGGIERLVSLTGPPSEVIRDHHSVKCILPESRMVLVERRYAAERFPAALPASISAARLAANYDFKDLGDGRIAGYRSKIIGILPRDQYRYGYRLWLDAHTGMLLRSDLLNADGHTVERVMFTMLQYHKSIPDKELQATEIGRGFVWNIQGDSEKLSPAETRVSWRATKLPPGFVLSLTDVQRVAGVEQPVRHLVFSDGLASVSVFAEAAGASHNALIGPSQMGAVNAFGRQVGDHHLTVVGAVPAATVRLIANSMRLVPSP